MTGARAPLSVRARFTARVLAALGSIGFAASVDAQSGPNAPPAHGPPVTLSAALSAAPSAAPTDSTARSQGALRAIEIWGGLAGRSPQWGILGEAPDMNFGLVALRWTRPIGRNADDLALSALEWTFDVIPIARMSPPLVSLRGTGVPCPNAGICVLEPDPSTRRFPKGSPFGVGVAPLGVTRRFRRASTISPFAGATGGVIWFDRPVPTTQAARFNFTFSVEGGLRIGRPDHSAVTLSYRFHHISNAGTGAENPALASHLVSIGVHRPLLRPPAQGQRADVAR